MKLRIPLCDAEALRYYFKAFQIPTETESKIEDPDKYEDEEDDDYYHVEQHNDWSKSLIKHHQYKPATLQAHRVCYDNLTQDDLKEHN